MYQSDILKLARTPQDFVVAQFIHGIYPVESLSLHQDQNSLVSGLHFLAPIGLRGGSGRADERVFLFFRNLPADFSTIHIQINHSPILRRYFQFVPYLYYRGGGYDPELSFHFQKLADLIAEAARDAFTEEYYPSPVDVEPMTDDHVSLVMDAMQREIDREYSRVSISDSSKWRPVYRDLPFERQRVLAERRRYYYGLFGITPSTWNPLYPYVSLSSMSNEPLHG